MNDKPKYPYMRKHHLAYKLKKYSDEFSGENSAKYISPENDYECPVCLETIADAKNALVEIHCKHKICNECFMKIKINDNIKCPLCRKIQNAIMRISDIIVTKIKTQYDLFNDEHTNVCKKYAYTAKSININYIMRELIKLNTKHEDFTINPIVTTDMDEKMPNFDRDFWNEKLFKATCLNLGWYKL